MKKVISFLLVPVLSLFLTSVSFAAEIGPLPEIKAPNPKRVELGRRYFHDTRASGDAAVSCATCHKPSEGFTTRNPLSEAYPGSLHWRNAPSLINTVYKKVWQWDGRLANLDDTLRDMITDSINMNHDMRQMAERFKQDANIVKLAKSAYGNSSGMGGAKPGEIIHYQVRKAIIEFLKTITSKNVPFDQGKLSGKAKLGLEIFKGKAGCINCHNGPLFTDEKPHNTGVPENPEVFKDPVRHMTYVAWMMFMGVENRMNWRRDVGHFSVTGDASDIGSFITPSLRELKYTAPYMHNGMLASLDDVIDFYDRGGGPDLPGLKDQLIKPLGLSKREKGALKAFLLGLSGDPIVVKDYETPAEYEIIPNFNEIEN